MIASVGHLLLDINNIVKSTLLPSDTQMNKTKFSFANNKSFMISVG